MASHVSSESRDPEFTKMDWRGMICWLHPRESGPDIDQGPGGMIASPTLFGPVLVGSQLKDMALLLTVRYFEST